MDKLIETLNQVGLSDKAASVYLAALELGEATVQELAERSKQKRTTLYYTLNELLALGALLESKRDKKIYYLAQSPQDLRKNIRERFQAFEDILPELDQRSHAAYPRPRVYFLYGVPGFKQIWQMIFKSKSREYCIITTGHSLLNYVSHKYLMSEIIGVKKQKNIHSRHIISDSREGRRIVGADKNENRSSKIISPQYKLPFTTIITDDLVAYISPRYEEVLLIIESQSFAQTQQSIFNLLWSNLPDIS